MPTPIQLAIYAKIIEGNAVRDVLNGAGGGNAQQLSVLNVLKKLCNTPGLLMQQLREVSSMLCSCSALGPDGIVSVGQRARHPAGPGRQAARGRWNGSFRLWPIRCVSLLFSVLFPCPHSLTLTFPFAGKMLALGSLLQKLREANEEKIVVVSNFTSTLDIIEKHCKSNKYPFCRLDGLVSRRLKRRVSIANSRSRFHSKTDQKERISIVNTFNRGPIKNNCECYSLRLGKHKLTALVAAVVFLLSSKSGGTGLNSEVYPHSCLKREADAFPLAVIGASRLVLVDLDWNPSVDLQAMAR